MDKTTRNHVVQDDRFKLLTGQRRDAVVEQRERTVEWSEHSEVGLKVCNCTVKASVFEYAGEDA